MFSTTDGGKKKESQPARKQISLNFGGEVANYIWKYEGGQSLSSVTYKLGFTVSTVNTTVKEASCHHM